MKYVGKKVLLGGIIFSVIAGVVVGLSDVFEDTKVGYAKPYGSDLDDYRGWAKRIKKSNSDLLKEHDSYVMYETSTTKKTKAEILAKSSELQEALDDMITKTDRFSKKVREVSSAEKSAVMDKALNSLKKDQDNAVKIYESIHNDDRRYIYERLDVLYETEEMFKKYHPESVTENGLPTEFDFAIRDYTKTALSKAGRDYVNKKIAEGYTKKRMDEWKETKFDDIVKDRQESNYVASLNMNDEDVWKFKKPLMERNFDGAVLMMVEYNTYFDGLKKRIDEMIKSDIEKESLR